jgi:hypothetical protein
MPSSIACTDDHRLLANSFLAQAPVHQLASHDSSPLVDPALQGPQLAVGEATRVGTAQTLE